jgi:GTP pyrophosphokinase
MEPGLHQSGAPLDAGPSTVTGAGGANSGSASAHSEFMLDPLTPGGKPNDPAGFVHTLPTGFTVGGASPPVPGATDAHQLLDAVGEVLLGPRGLPTAAINAPEAPTRRHRPGHPAERHQPDRNTRDRVQQERQRADRPYVDRSSADRSDPGRAAPDTDEPGMYADSAQDRSAQDRSPQDRSGQDRSAQDRSAQDRSPEDRSTQDRGGQDRDAQDRSPEDRSTQDRSGQHRSDHDQATQGRSAQGVGDHDQATQGRSTRDAGGQDPGDHEVDAREADHSKAGHRGTDRRDTGRRGTDQGETGQRERADPDGGDQGLGGVKAADAGGGGETRSKPGRVEAQTAENHPAAQTARDDQTNDATPGQRVPQDDESQQELLARQVARDHTAAGTAATAETTATGTATSGTTAAGTAAAGTAAGEGVAAGTAAGESGPADGVLVERGSAERSAPGQGEVAPGQRPPRRESGSQERRVPRDEQETPAQWAAQGQRAPQSQRAPHDQGETRRDWPANERPAGSRPPVARPGERSTTERPGGERPRNERSTIEHRPTTDRTATDQPDAGRTATDRAATDRTLTDRTATDTPAAGTGAHEQRAADAPAPSKRDRAGKDADRAAARRAMPVDDRFAAPRARLTAPPTEDSPATPPPPTYSALVGGAVPGDPTGTYSAIIGSRLRAMLPWQTTEDPMANVLRSHRTIHPTGDVALLRRAYATAEQMHRGQMRKSGEAFISHPLEVTEILADLGMDTTTLVASLLHDTVEDTDYTLGALERDFGGEVALLVDGVTKFDKMFYGADAEAETIRKMIVAAGRDVRVLVIKLADRLHNMRTLDARSIKSQVRIATATREVLIPLCERLGIQALKRELEDWVLRAVSPGGYALIDEYVRQRTGWDGYLERVIAAVTTDLKKFSIDAQVSPRPRHLYSIWKDTVDGNYEDPHDMPRVVIIVEGPETDCYAALGAVHGKWRPVPGRFKDFIATPKGNNYKSLHTTVLGPEGRSLEVLIRTEEMHQAAEYGIVANFRYPHTAARFGPASKAEQLNWLRRLLDWEAAASDPSQFIASLRCDLAEDQILVLAEGGGRPVLLPQDATPVDLAYILGADVGNRCIGAKVNGRLIAVSSPLADGDTVEIITRTGQRDEFDFDADAPARGPSPEWLEFVKTPHARLHISRWFEAHEAPAITVANKVRLGRLAIGLALRGQGRGLASDLPLVRLAARLGYPDLETLLVAVADHSRTADEVVEELIALVDHSPR